MANRLAHAASSYLRQHAENPVDWFHWGHDAFDEAKQRDVPIFLSIGYSTCHWCHVMAEESFAHEHTAAILNERFVAIKVDSEERPDVNATYMQVVQTMTGRGGWPISVFLTPDGRPFLAGSYWPKETRNGLPAFQRVLLAASKAWQQKRDQVIAKAEQLSSFLSGRATHSTGAGEVDPSTADDAARRLAQERWDRLNGGFGAAPKFPHAMTIDWLLHRHARTHDSEPLRAALHALRAMAGGGIHDQLGGGFSRYTVDEAWSWPHFEKMLYDNALLLPAYAGAAALTGDRELGDVARTTAHYLLSGLQAEHGGFASATDADAGGVEGAYYTWSYDELVEVLTEAGVEPRPWTAFLGASPQGNWHGTNVLRRVTAADKMAQRLDLARDSWDDEWSRVKSYLLARRAERVPPQTEHRVLTDWNALAVRGLVRSGQLLAEPAWVGSAAAGANFLHRELVVGARLRHSWRDGHATGDGFLLDYAALALADLELFQATGEPVWFDRGVALAAEADARFRDGSQTGWFESSPDPDGLVPRQGVAGDNAIPAGSSVMVEVCLVLAGLTGEQAWQSRAEGAIASRQERARTDAVNHGWLLRQLEAVATGQQQVAIVGRPSTDRDALTRTAVGRPRPGTVTVTTTGDTTHAIPILAGREEIDGRPTAYVCRQLSCSRPVSSTTALAETLDG